jgi:hypothetical protein
VRLVDAVYRVADAFYGAGGIDLDRHRVAQDIIGQMPHFWRHGRRKQQGSGAERALS